MTANLGLIAYATKRDTHELTAQRPRDRLPERGLAHTRRTDQRHHRARTTTADNLQSALRAAGADREIFHDPVLDILQTVVVSIQHLTRGGDVGRVSRFGVPGQLEDGVQPGTDPTRFRTLVAGPLELANLSECGLAYLVRQVGRLNARPIVLSTVRLVLAQFLADRIQLLSQQELALALLHPLANIVGDLLVDFGLGDVRLGPFDQRRKPRHDIRSFQQLALPFVTQPWCVPSEVSQRRRIGDPVDCVNDLPGVAALQRGNHESLVFGGELADFLGIVRRLGEFLSLNPERSTRARDSGSDLDSPLGPDHRRRFSGGKPAELHDRGHHTERRVAVLKAGRDEQRVIAVGFRRIHCCAGGVVELDR